VSDLKVNQMRIDMNTLELDQMEQIEGGGLSVSDAAGCLISTGAWGYAAVVAVLAGGGFGLLALTGAAIALGCMVD
jgi:hypothetical protein